MKTNLTQKRLKELLHYDPDTGVFRWKIAHSRRVHVGDVTGCLDAHRGYLRIGVCGRVYTAHRLAWLYIHGCWPKNQTDHINGIRHDNRIVNLREATNAENRQNRELDPRNTSGFPGVHLHKRSGKWRANIMINRRMIHLGLFDGPKEAADAYLKAKAKYHIFNPTMRTAQNLEARA